MAQSWFNRSGGAPGGWGPGQERRQQSERVRGTLGEAVGAELPLPGPHSCSKESFKLLLVKHPVLWQNSASGASQGLQGQTLQPDAWV